MQKGTYLKYTNDLLDATAASGLLCFCRLFEKVFVEFGTELAASPGSMRYLWVSTEIVFDFFNFVASSLSLPLQKTEVCKSLF